MSLGTILYNIVVMPIQIIYEIIFNCVYTNITNNYGVTIIILSLTVSILVLPLYKRADAIQKEERDIEAKLKKGVDHIKKTFKGNEQMMMLQEYYRQNNYKPTYVIKGLLPLLLQIPFFMAAYNFLSNYTALKGVSFGPLTDLGSPDGLLTIFGITINVLPILMTLINFISSYIYTKGFPLKNKIQLYGIAIIFLVLLYNKPAGLTFYWTLNNLFSLVKNIFYKLNNKKKVLSIISLISGIFIVLFGVFGSYITSVKQPITIKALLIVLGLILITIFFISKYRKNQIVNIRNDSKTFVVCSAFLSILIGLVIPSSVIVASPQEFVVVGVLENPLMYLVSSFTIAIGMFILWFGVFYLLTNKKYRYIFDIILCLLCFVSIINYLFFNENFGFISTSLQYENEMIFTYKQVVLNILVLFMVGVFVVVIMISKYKTFIKNTIVMGTIALIVLSGISIFKIQDSINQINYDNLNKYTNNISFNFSTKGKNVIIIMLDRALGSYAPYIFEEKPELKEKFSGFTLYPNTISYSSHTMTASPALFGGYEYTPIELNKRDTELLKDKHNESLKVIPVLFYNHGYKVSVTDLPCPNYQLYSDLSIFDEYPGINKMVTKEAFSSYLKKDQININMRNLFCYGLLKTSPIITQRFIYDYGRYNNRKLTAPTTQTITNKSEASGNNFEFLKYYDVLDNLKNITKITETNNTLLVFQNAATHEPTLLQKPNYTPLATVDNNEYDGNCYSEYIIDGKKLNLNNISQISHYHSNVGVLMKLGDWFDYLKKEGVYDNSRIIIVADHGRDVNAFNDSIITYEDNQKYDLGFFHPLLMVKDFDSKEFYISNELMTNADVPTLATNGIITNPVNPFTGKKINSDKKNDDIYVFGSNSNSHYPDNTAYTIDPTGVWFKLKRNIIELGNNSWEYISSDTLFPMR